MEAIHLIFRLLALSQVFLLTAYLLLFQRNRNGSLLALLSFGFLAYLAQPVIVEEFGRSYLLYTMSFVATTIPAIIWLLANRLINDSEEIPVWFVILTLLYLSLWYAGDLQLLTIENEELAGILFQLVPQLVKLGLVGHVVLMAQMGRETDLVAKRLRLRTPLALSASLIVGVVMLVELWLGSETQLVVEAIGSVLMFLAAIAANLILLRWRADLPLNDPVKPKPPSPDQTTNTETLESIAHIEHAMAEGRFYASHGATLGDLAERLNIQPHRLRGLINQYMGYKNFNQFLNHYRIQEAAERLQKESELPVLTIALDVGFKSMSSFNTAFKAIHHATATDYRTARREQS
ncbi:MAG: transcriptional regulator [Pseudohongiella sp.]|nr:MAG: transcriptional regulator [Pseudohongiella sp.]